MKAIETSYKGYRFRSRLEARWAVFFDALGIQWEYEEEEYQIDDEYYLPDFRLYSQFHSKTPRKATDLFVEVKGDPEGLIKEADRQIYLHDFGECLPGFAHSYGSTTAGLILLGNIPEPGNGATHFHPIVQHRKGLVKSWFMFRPYPAGHQIEIIEDGCLAHLLGLEVNDCLEGDHRGWMVETRSALLPSYYNSVDKAYHSARSARFEHGETPR